MRLRLVALALALGAIPVLASASHVDVPDPNDVRGLLDVRVVETPRAARFRVVTYARWTAERIWDRGYLLVLLDTFDTSRFDYYVLVSSDGRRMQAELWRDRVTRPDRRIRLVPARRFGPRSVVVRVPLDDLRMRATQPLYRWIVETLFTGPRCRRVCIDRAPDEGAVLEPRIKPTPTPTVTPTATPTP